MSLIINSNYLLGSVEVLNNNDNTFYKCFIFDSNYLLVFIYFKDENNGEVWFTIKKLKELKKFLKFDYFYKSFRKFKLNIRYKEMLKVVDVLTKNGFEIEVYYE